MQKISEERATYQKLLNPTSRRKNIREDPHEIRLVIPFGLVYKLGSKGTDGTYCQPALQLVDESLQFKTDPYFEILLPVILLFKKHRQQSVS
jgi:hypothetical protein